MLRTVAHEFDWREYVTIAEHLKSQIGKPDSRNDEAKIRAAVSRVF
jgi:hypothetical protein